MLPAPYNLYQLFVDTQNWYMKLLVAAALIFVPKFVINVKLIN
jgi:hypothetical protein